MPLLARRPSALYQLQKFAKRNKALATGITVALTALLVGLVTSSYMYFEAETARAGEAQRATELTRVTAFHSQGCGSRDQSRCATSYSDCTICPSRVLVAMCLNLISW